MSYRMTLLALLAWSIALQGMLKKTIVAFDLAIISAKEDPDAASARSASMGKSIFTGWRIATGIKLWANQKVIDKKGKELSRTETGTANVTRTVLKEYGVTEDEIKQLTEAAINPELKKLELAFFTELKEQGCKIIGITDQDQIHHEFFRKKAATNCDFDNFLDGVITIPYLGDPLGEGEAYRPHKPNWLIAKPGCTTSACQALRALANSIDPHAPVILVDIKKNASPEIQIAQNIQTISYHSLEQLKAFFNKE